MTILKVDSVYGDDYYLVEADEDDVQEAVDELICQYYDETPEEDQDDQEKVDYILSGLENRGFDFWGAGIVTIYQ